MEITDKKENMAKKDRSVMGILAHVDAGKTTLAEAMLFLSGAIKKLGRVDHRSAALDNFSLERERGITIFSKEAVMELPTLALTLLDTPGHAELAAQAERVLPVLDCAVLVISGSEGVQAHTETIWRLLRRYSVPTFIFVSKMDMPDCSQEEIMAGLRQKLGEGCVDFSAPKEEMQEKLAMLSETAMDRYLEKGALEREDIRALIKERALFPCLFGSGLKTDGVEDFLFALEQYAPRTGDKGEFSARVYKIDRDAQGARVSHIKLTGGSLAVRQNLKYSDPDGGEHEEKISQIRIYNGAKYETVERVYAGQVCAVPNLAATWPGQGLGNENNAERPLLESALRYAVILPEGCELAAALPKLTQLAEEEPQLHLALDRDRKGCSVQLMGRVQREVFISLVKERFDLDIRLDSGRVMFKETIAEKVEGVGHFEPLRHYAEVHLLMEPLPAGSGIELCSLVPEDELDRNWQRLIMTNLAEKQHLGVLTGSPITDMRISLAAGRAHIKHTEGGDFREAVYRAVRQGLMGAKNVLLEPYYDFSVTVPTEQIGRVISDVRAMNGVFDSPEQRGDMSRLSGSAPAAAMNGYMETLSAFSRGKGVLTLTGGDYRPCAQQEKIVESIGYQPERDLENPADSVFCAHGGGFNVKWDKVKEYMHLESCLKPKPTETAPRVHRSLDIDQRELDEIMLREFGPVKRPTYRAPVVNAAPEREERISKKAYVIVDGYNLVFAWEELKKLAAENLDLAREHLMDILAGYCSFTKAEVVLVFDAYRNSTGAARHFEHSGVRVVFTGVGESGDAYIERLVNEIGQNYAVRVITSDNLIRLSALRSGVLRTSSAEFAKELEWTLAQIDEILKKSNQNTHTARLKDAGQ